jgi:hypothetical protein
VKNEEVGERAPDGVRRERACIIPVVLQASVGFSLVDSLRGGFAQAECSSRLARAAPRWCNLRRPWKRDLSDKDAAAGGAGGDLRAEHGRELSG